MSGVRLDQTVHAQRVAEVNAGIQLPGGLGAVADLPAGLRKALDIRPLRKEPAPWQQRLPPFLMYPSSCRSWNNSPASAQRDTPAMTDTPSMRERMLAGELYIADDPELAE